MKKITKITFEYDDESKQTIEGEAAILFQVRVNTAGILSGVQVNEEE